MYQTYSFSDSSCQRFSNFLDEPRDKNVLMKIQSIDRRLVATRKIFYSMLMQVAKQGFLKLEKF